MTELKPCPFCGGEAHVIPQVDGISGTVKYSVYCDSRCGVVAFYYATEAEALAAWNTRTERTCHAKSDLSEWVCSNCQCWIPLGLTPQNIKHASEWRYCPHCGARVIGVDE